MQKTMKFSLNEPIEFTNNGDFDKAYELEFKAPSYEQRAAARKLKQCLVRAVIAGRNLATKDGDGKKADDESVTGEAIGMFLMASDQDYNEVVDVFCGLATSVGYITEDVRLKTAHIQKIDPDEIDRMCNEYIAFFIAPSLFSTMSGESTK